MTFKFRFIIIAAGLCLALSHNTKAQSGLCLTPQVTYSVPTHPNGMATGDFNNDGKADLAVASQDLDSVSILTGDGTGVFSARVNYLVGSQPQSISVADFNHDGYSDLVVANQLSSTICILLGSSTGTFAAAVSYTVGHYYNATTSAMPNSVTSADFDGDGNMDVAVSNFFLDSASVLLGTGTGTFADAVRYPTGQGSLLPAI